MSEMGPVVAFGGGTDSTGLLIEMFSRGVVPSLIQFADTGNRDAEKPETYAHVDRMDAWCMERWGIGIAIVQNDGIHGTLEYDCLRGNRLPSIVYGFKACSDKYKLRPQMKALKSFQPAIDCWASGGKVTRFVGFNADEWHRVKNFDDPRFSVRYPLVEWGITRRMAQERCFSELGYVPSKSACFFCPSSKKSEVLRLKREHPDLFARAVEMERNMDMSPRTVEFDCPACGGGELATPGCIACEGFGTVAEQRDPTVVGLGRHWSWEGLVAADENQFKLFEEPAEMPCMCFDGDAA